MIARFLVGVLKILLRLRYRIKVTGLNKIKPVAGRGTLFLPNHPAISDPPLLFSILYKRFRPYLLADRDRVKILSHLGLKDELHLIEMPDPAVYGPAARSEIEKRVADIGRILASGGNALVYPAGRIYRSRKEDLRGASATETLLKAAPNARVVLVRTSGLWGSMFSACHGRPEIVSAFGGAAVKLAMNLFFLMPKRKITVEFVEDANIHALKGRAAINEYLERFYAGAEQPASSVPYFFWLGRHPYLLPEPAPLHDNADIIAVPSPVRETVMAKLRAVSGVTQIQETCRLDGELSMDSLSIMDLAVWIEEEFGYSVDNPAALETVHDVLLAACGSVVKPAGAGMRPPNAEWLLPTARAAAVPEADNVLQAFGRQLRFGMGRPICADGMAGVKTFRTVCTGVFLLSEEISRFDGDYIGVMLPASTAAPALTLAVMLAGKTPVMINWTAGIKNLAAPLEKMGVKKILTSQALVFKLRARVEDLGDLDSKFVMLEDLADTFTTWRKLRALLRTFTDVDKIENAAVRDVACVLFTSGSESVPKAVPLTHKNVLANMRDMLHFFSFNNRDVMVGILPPFHSFGLNCTTFLPLCTGLRVVYHPNPTEGAAVAELVSAYKGTMLIGTPTFLTGILRSAEAGELSSMRVMVSGAEKCPRRVYEELARNWPGARLVEGYGITECSPVVSANPYENGKTGSIGVLMKTVSCVLMDPETEAITPPPGKGVLLVSGPSIFDGYINYAGPSPFVEHDGRQWYRTGDIVRVDEDGYLFFEGRLKRFIKLGGEMISLPAIEEALNAAFRKPEDENPVLAVDAVSADENPLLTLLAVRDITREQANKAIAQSGLSPLHNVRQVVRVEEIPVLGTGKTDYRAIKALLAGHASVAK